MAELWNQNDRGWEASDGAVSRYNRDTHIGFFAFPDGTCLKYDAGNDLLDFYFHDGTDFNYNAASHALVLQFLDGAIIEYNAASSAFSIQLPAGATYTIQANGASIQIDAAGDISHISPTMVTVVAPIVNVEGAEVLLAGGGPPVARVGDSTTCPAGQGTITSGSVRTSSG